MKKTYILIGIIGLFLLSGCNTSNSNIDNSKLNSLNLKECKNFYRVGENFSQTLNLKAKVISDRVKNILANNGGIISYLNCEPGMEVKSNTLIAKIIPDWSDPNIKSLLNQKKSLQNQILNTENIITSTKNSFDSQLKSLEIQKENLELQIKNLTDTLEKLNKQKDYGVGDLSTQLKSLETQLKDLEKSKSKLEQTKQAELSKLNKNIENTILQAKSLIKTIFLKIDEIYGITDENRHKNDAFESYLSAKNTSLKEKIKNKFIELNNKKVENWSLYLQEVDNFVNLVKKSIKSSVSSRTLSQDMIDTWYGLFSEYDTNLINLKNSLDTLIKNLDTIKNNYDTQILSLQTQINSVKNSIENIKNNKLGSYISSIDIQINQTKSQLDTTKSNLENINSQISSLKNQKEIQIKQLENQLSQLKSSLNSVNINLSTQNIYAKVEGKVKVKKISVNNKVGPNTLLCQIIPNKASLKLQVYM